VRYFQDHVVSRGDVFRVWMKEGDTVGMAGSKTLEAWHEGQWYVCAIRAVVLLGDMGRFTNPARDLTPSLLYAGHVPLFAASKWAGEQG
jgi:hypothetical protein